MMRWLLWAVLCLALGSAALAGAGYWYLQSNLAKPLQLPEEPWILDIAPGRPLSSIARQLEREGIIADRRVLKYYARFTGDAARIQAGEYALSGNLDSRGLLDLLRSGEVVQYAVTLVDGHRFQDFRVALAQAEKVTQTLGGVSDQAIMARMGAPATHPEGQFFPDTYFYTKGTTDFALLQRAYRRMQDTLREAWAERADALPYETPYQALIMASIVERETAVAMERDRIAGVFVRRLQRGMRLQTDPTVIYGMGDAYQGRITRADLRRPTPYNTYVIKGLPPTPIANPGREAIVAALNPKPGKALYFVARGDGTHQFSETLAEHNRAVREYQLNRRADYRSTPERQ